MLFFTLLLFFNTDRPVPEIISRSSANGGKPIMLTDDIERLWRALKDLHAIFLDPQLRVIPGNYNCVDVEFLILDNEKRDIVILQCRPLKLIR